MSSLIGYLLPEDSTLKISLLHLLIGTALTGAGAHALNQWQERVPDGMMERTCNRPLPSGRLSAEEALAFSMLLSLLGTIYLWVFINPLTSLLGAVTLLSYVLVYTPLKSRTELNTWLGAITGALPPLMGWTAQQGALEAKCLPIFALLYFWQLPHFFAIAWMYREDYRKGCFRMLSLDDDKGDKTAFQMLVNGTLLLMVSFSFYFVDQGGFFFLIIALLCGAGFMLPIVRFTIDRSVERAKRVFLASIVYLPVLCSVIVVDRLFLN